MSIQAEIDSVKEKLEAAYVLDQSEATQILLKANKVVFLDTCFLSRMQHLDSNAIYQGFVSLFGENELVVYVVTELMLYELIDERTKTLQKYANDFFAVANKSQSHVVILKEELIKDNLQPFLSMKNHEWNEKFVSLLKENKANLLFLMKKIKSNELTYSNICSPGMPVPKTADFVKIFISEIKEQKTKKDSLAEELIAICILLISLIWDKRGSNSKTEVIFCTDDFDASKRVKKALDNSLKDTTISYNKMHSFTFVEYLVRQNILTDVKETENVLRKMVGSEIIVYEEPPIPYGASINKMDISEAVDMMFKGEKVNYLPEKMK